ncbi:MAG: hypothetical protein JXQ89_21185 [Pelagimonas sp.]
MTTSHRKLDQTDFYRRSLRVDPTQQRGWRSAYPEVEPRAFRLAIFGFVWAGFCLLLAYNRSGVESFLSEASLSPYRQFVAIAGCTVFLSYSMVKMGAHAVQTLITRGPRRGNSIGLVIGASIAFALTLVPQDTWVTLAAQIDQTVQTYLEQEKDEIQSALPKLDEINITFLSAIKP